MQTSLQFRFNQQLTMTPQLQQAIRFLQLSSLELETEIKTALETNFLLEQVESIEEVQEKEISILEDSDPAETFLQTIATTDDSSSYFDKRLESLSHNHTMILRDYLSWQMELLPLSLRERAIAIALIDAISDEGYLTLSAKEIQESINEDIQQEEIENALKKIHQFDPVGVGARDLSECLLIQLDNIPENTPALSTAKCLARDHLKALGSGECQRLRKKLKLSSPSFDIAVKLLMSLDPKPGNRIQCKNSDYIIPDIVATKKNNRIIVELNHERLPKLRVNSSYVHLLQTSQHENHRQTFKIKLKEAKWFLRSLKNRYETLLTVTQSILEKQSEFLDGGESKMKPLSLQNIADEVNLHESTISRVTNQKYIMTPRGLFELKYFFSNSVASRDGEKVSAVAIRAIIKKLIAKEPSQSPLSDHKITQVLAEQGINIARRTVTKYREALGLPSSHERKSLGFKS